MVVIVVVILLVAWYSSFDAIRAAYSPTGVVVNVGRGEDPSLLDGGLYACHEGDHSEPS